MDFDIPKSIIELSIEEILGTTTFQTTVNQEYEEVKLSYIDHISLALTL